MISSKNSLSFMNICTLIDIETTENEYGVPTETETKTDVFCAEIPITSNEFFKARDSGIKTQKCLVVNSDEYNEQTLIEYEGKPYSVYRVYANTDGYTELYCAERIGNG